MMNDIYDLDTQKKVRYVSESSNTSGYSTMSPGPSVHGGGGIIGGIGGGAVGNISPASSTLFSMPPSPALSPATAALQNDFSNLNLPSNSPQQLPLPQQQHQQPPPPSMQQQFTTLQNVPHVYANHNYNNYSNVMQCQPTTATAATMSISSSLHKIKSEYTAQLRILEQPAEKFRFRYKSEMHGTHGSLNGVNSKRTPKTFPEVCLDNFTGNAVIRCSLFQTDIDSPHSHQLVVRKDDMDICDPHTLYVSQDKGYVAQFQNMGIIHTAKKFIFEELLKKKKNRKTFELGRNDLSTREEQELRKETEKEAKAMNLNQVRLCFEAFKIEEDGTWAPIAAPVCTHSINNRKSAQTGELRICRLSIASGSVSGGDDLILLVEKVSKKNIKVRFYEINDDEETVWEAYGKFRESDVHHQYAIVCTTPAYKNKDIDKPVEVFIELIRPSDDERSFPPVTFRYKPRDAIVSRKRRRTCSTATTSSSSNNSMNSFELPKILQEQGNVMQPPTAAMTTEYQQQQQQLQQHQLMLQQQQQQQLGGPPTISEEFNKDQQLRNLYNSEEFRQMINTNSEELRIICDSFPLEGYLEHDGTSSSSSSSIALDKNHGSQNKKFIQSKQYISTSSAPSQTINVHLQRIFKLHQDARNEVPNTSKYHAVAKQISEIFIEFATKNDEFDSIMHEIILTDNIKLGIKTCEIMKFFNLEELLNTSINSNGESCLHCACLHNKSHFIRPLLLMGVDPNIQDHIGNTALHIAVQERNKNCIESFLIYMASSPKLRLNLNLTNDAGLTPLHLAIRNNMLDNIEKLLRYDKSAVLVCNTKDGNNALHMAVLQQNVPLIKLIMELHNVDLETRNAAGRTVLDLTKMLDPAVRKEILELLLQTTTEDGSQQPSVKVEDTESSSSTDDEEIEEDEQMQEPLELIKIKFEVEESNTEDSAAALDLNAKLHKILCDAKKFSELSQKLDINQIWKPLAKQLKMQHLLCLWSSADAMLKYVRDNVQSIGYATFTEALALVDKDTLILLQSM